MSLVTNIVILASVSCGVFGLASLVVPAERSPWTAGLSIRKNRSTVARYFSQFGQSLLPSDEGDRSSARLFLLQAGFDSPDAPATYFGIRTALAIILPLLVTTYLVLHTGIALNRALIYAVITAMAAYLLPMYYVRRRQRINQRIVTEGLPDVLDLLLVCSEAGLGLDMAIARVGEELGSTQPLLAKHLRQIGNELRAGRTRADAMRGFSDRTGTADTNSLVRLLIQSDVQGTSITQTLRVFSEEMRAHRMLRAEETAHTLSAKLSMVLIGSFMPALFIGIGGPVLLKVLAALKGISH